MTQQRWLKGNIHTHTIYSSDSSDGEPELIADWYADHGYDFIFFTDHNAMVPDAHLAKVQGRGLPVWQGEEITMARVHVGALGIQQPIFPPEPRGEFAEPYLARPSSERIRWAIAEVRAQGGVPILNHPNFRWHLTLDDILAVGEVPLFEVANMAGTGPEKNLGMPGDPQHPSTDQLWDMLLGRGQRVWGVASDDAHHFHKWGPEFLNPGRGWVMVEAERGSLESTLAALRDGRFYASVGPRLADYRVTTGELMLELATEPASIELVSVGGEVLDRVDDATAATFELTRVNSPYVRARVLVSGRPALWTQPVFR